MREFLTHLFLPVATNQFRARVLHPQFLAGYMFLLLLPFFIFGMLLVAKPGILGISAIFDAEKIIAKTNQARANVGASKLSISPKLTEAAQTKAQDMVTRGYWAHFAPDGKTPWDFIRQSGYNFSAAGENLARDFDSVDPMISAWLASPSHAENLLSANYTEIGIGTAEGVISGKKTTIVVQMFGKPAFIPVAAVQPKPVQAQTTLIGQTVKAEVQQLAQKTQNPEFIDVQKLVKPTIVNYFIPAKTMSLAVIALVAVLFALDLVFAKISKVTITRGHAIFHLMILTVVLFAVWYSNSGLIL